MIDVNQKERKCARYLANEMSKAEQFVFEIELSIDNELLSIFENFKLIWACYPQKKLPEQTITLGQTIERYSKPEKQIESTRKNSIIRRVTISFGFLLLLGLGFYWISLSSSGYANYRVAEKGQRLTFILPDSSTVILNSGSEVKYSSNFGKKRDIWLKGEAFFKVTKDKNSPFIVHTSDFDVKVLGTEFNVNSAILNQTVSLDKGKVKVLFKETKDEIDLSPKEQLVWNPKTKIIIKRNFDVNKVLAWKDNILFLDDIKIKEALPKINQFYGVNFLIMDSRIANQRIRGAFKNQSIEEFINSLEFISDVSITRNFQDNYEIKKSHEK